MSSSSPDFTWPSQYHFPPFFTIQPNSDTRRVQLLVWSNFILNYCKSHRIFILDKKDADIPLFHNPIISRRLSIGALDIILEDMKVNGQIDWVDGNKDRCYVYWHSPTEWGHILYKYAQENHLTNTVETLYSLQRDPSAEFRDMDTRMLIQCLKTLHVHGKAEVMGDEGVKFF